MGSKGTLRSTGADLSAQSLNYSRQPTRKCAAGRLMVPDGFWGTMSELLCAIEEKREPRNSARHNLRSLELCFAACAMR
jgi:hypothetical protein